MVKFFMETEKSNLEELKNDYELIREKYNLPSFDEMNLDFGIEKIAEVETDYLVREIRKFIADKFSSYLRFVEALLHPTSAPMFVLSLIKLISTEEKKKLVDIYGKLAKMEMKVIELDLNFVEEKEVDFVKSSYNIWQEIKNDLLIFINRIEKDWDTKPEVNGKNYFG